MVVFARKWVLRLAFWLCYPLPLRDRIVLASSHTRELTGNLRCIYDELVARGMQDHVRILRHASSGGVLGKLVSLLDGVRGEYYLATSRVFIVDDYYFPLYVAKPKPDTRVIQTWHASGAFKKIGFSVIDKTFGASRDLVKRVRIHSNYDYCLMGSTASVPAYSEAFGQPAEKFVTSLGIPRTDVYFDEARMRRTVDDVRARYELPDGAKVMLYAPTFRGTSKHGAQTPTELDLDVLHEVLGGEWIVLVRLHPFVAKDLHIDDSLRGFAYDVSSHPDINDLMIASDLLLTDYSSVIFEYSLLERPMVFFAPDIDEYEAERSFYFDYRTGVPGPVFLETGPLAEYVRSGDFDPETVRRFKDRSFEVADGHATQRVVEALILPALSQKATAAKR